MTAFIFILSLLFVAVYPSSDDTGTSTLAFNWYCPRCLARKGQATNSFPLNAAVVTGQTVTFNCRTKPHNSVYWRYIAVGSKTDSILFNGINMAEYACDSCSINNTEPGQYDLQIPNTRQTDAGTYICVEIKETDINVSKVDYHSAELIIIVSVPQCGSNLTGSNASLLDDNDSVRMWCRVEFRGNIAPTMEWQNKATDEVIPSRTTNHQNIKVESDIIVHMIQGNNRDDVAYSCATYFNQSFYEAHATIYSVAKNAPDYAYNWTSQEETHWRTRPVLIGSEYTSSRSHVEETARNCHEIVIGLVAAVIILATSTITFFIGYFVAMKRIRKDKTKINMSPNITGSHDIRPAAEYEEMQETDQQSLGLPVYQNVPILQTEYQQIEMIDQQS